MTGAEVREVFQRCERWINTLGLQQWEIALEYCATTAEYNRRRPEAVGSAASARTQWEYMRATIVFDCEDCAGYTVPEVQRIFLHELAHVFVHEMRAGTRCECPYDIRHEERVCTMLAQAFFAILGAL